MEAPADNNSVKEVIPESTTPKAITEGTAAQVVVKTTNVDTVPQKLRRGGEAWGIDFSPPKMRRKTTRKEREAIVASRLQRLTQEKQSPDEKEANEAVKANELQESGECGGTGGSNNQPLPVVRVDAMASRRCLIPTQLPTTRADLEERLCLRIPRLLCVTKQYPRSCGVSSLTSIWNYLYTRIGEAATTTGMDGRPPVSQEEVMSILGFEPPFDTIAWGPFTGNGTLLRWFHAINRHFGVRGRAYVLYKPQGTCRTTCTSEEALQELKSLLRNPNAAVIYHCHNHYMVPVGYQEIPVAQTEFYAKEVPVEDTETTVFIGEVSRGKHAAMYARKWSEIVKDLMCRSPKFYNIRHPELGIQTRAPKCKADSTGNDNDPNKRLTNQEENQQEEEKSNEKQEEEVTSGGLEQLSPSVVVEETPPTLEVASEVLPITVDCVEDNTNPTTTSKKKTKKKSKGGNLHCLICFRCDEVEEHMEQYENPSSSSSSSGSRSSRSSSSSGSNSDEPKADDVE